ncbi:hypothetical protein [Mitsuaria sp. 7]|uniref:hypothetical protein n=1 Tax=Mitsuaria sp. 7 TaxID=1658665 RepID=UPI0007DD6ADD|nr:hypothetical protein [Mitsuaria sp. 7]ANH70972.1 hypothetical protein ABE85_25935 [Mitsuaria sp. 7]
MTALALEADVLELRVLSGLQSGAALPLDGMLTVGPGDDADLLLLDDAGTSARLCVSLAPDGGLVLEALETGVVLAGGSTLASGTSMPLRPGEAFRTGGTWLTVRHASDPWDAWTPPPAVTASPENEPARGAEDDTTGAMAPDAAIVADDLRPLRSRGRVRSSAPRSMRTVGSLIVAAGLLSTMLGVAALVRQAADGEAPQVPGADPAKTGTPATDGRRATPAVRAASAVAPLTATSPAMSPASAPGSSGASSPESSTASTMGVATPPPSLSETAAIPGATSDRSGGRDRLLVNVPGDGVVILPFDIREVLLGADSHVILTNGRRLAPGDRVGEWRLAEIRPGALVFDGPRKVLVGW